MATRVEPEELWIHYWGLLNRSLQDAFAGEEELSSYDDDT